MKITCLNVSDEDVPKMFKAFDLKMEEQGLPPIVINVFKCYYARLLYGAQGKITEKEIEPLGEDEIRSYGELGEYVDPGMQAMKRAVVVKLNGGLGTSMGLEKAKSLIPVRDGLTFLDFIVRQMERLREKYTIKLPLLLMNSFKTHLDTMMEMGDFDNGDSDIPLAFVQHKYPKILERDYSPAVWPENPELEWNPPGHGDIYTALVTSGMLSKLLKKGYHYAFISNSDNLGAIMDERILGYMARERLPFLMEVAERTPSDRKGGHLARLKKNDRMILREVAQCPEGDMEAFQDIERYRYFNTNSVWLDLRALEQVFLRHHMMPLDLILNPKNVDPRNPDSPKCIQVETAMGAAISAFEDATAVHVPRTRFAPVKTTNDLLVVMSDCYHRTQSETLELSEDCTYPLPQVDLDERHYKKIDDFSERFPQGVPSLKECTTLKVRGDVLFGGGVSCVGDVFVQNRGEEQARVEDVELTGSVDLD